MTQLTAEVLTKINSVAGKAYDVRSIATLVIRTILNCKKLKLKKTAKTTKPNGKRLKKLLR